MSLQPAFTSTNVSAQDGEDAIDLQQIFSLLWSAKWRVLLVTFGVVLLGILYVLVARPVYEADGVVQVEDPNSGIAASLGSSELGTLLGAPMKTEAELQILRSRMVLDKVIGHLKLDIEVSPKYFPVIGAPIVQRYKDVDTLAPPMLGLSSFAWGGEKIEVTTLDVPADLLDKQLIIRSGDGGSFTLEDTDAQRLLSGHVGEVVTAASPYGPIKIFVRELRSRPGTRFKVRRLSQEHTLNMLLDKLTITEQGKDSGVIGLSYRGPTARNVTEIVNNIEDAYLAQNVERRSAEAQQSLEFLQRQLPELKAKVDNAQRNLNAYQVQKGSVDVTKETDLVLQQSVDLETQRIQLEQQREQALLRFTKDHPAIRAIDAQLIGIAREEAELKQRTAALPETQQEILTLQEDLDINTQLYTSLLNSTQQLQVTKAGTIGNVRIIDYALLPLGPVLPKPTLVLVLSLMLGLMLGVANVYLQTALQRGIDRPEEVERALGVPTYASVPYAAIQKRLARAMSRKEHGDFVLALVDTENPAVESLRSLRTSLHFAMLEAANNVVMLTGPTPGLGKSFVSVNLGAVLAQAGKKVVIVDGDLRRGRLSRYFDILQTPGLSDYVANSADLGSVVQKTKVEGLCLVTKGTTPPNPAELLMHERFAGFVKYLSSQFDYVLIDTPPVLPVTDAAIVGRLAGSTLLVLKAGEHTIRVVEETARRLQQAGVKVNGVIFNQMGARMGSYGYGTYGYGYGYSYSSHYRSE
jgi:tyrosine-protein kinase Etk/Wzc